MFRPLHVKDFSPASAGPAFGHFCMADRAEYIYGNISLPMSGFCRILRISAHLQCTGTTDSYTKVNTSLCFFKWFESSFDVKRHFLSQFKLSS